MHQALSGHELRKSERIKTDATAIVLFPNERTRVPCRMIDRSQGGVQLRISGSARLPKEFFLLIGNPEFRLVCRIAWRIGARAGCQFISQFSNQDEENGQIIPIDADSAKGIIRSRLLKRPLIIS